MDLLKTLKDLGKGADYIETNNYYFQTHTCPADGKEKKIMLDYTLSSDVVDNILRIGICKDCGQVYYHKDFSAKSF